MQKFIGLVSMLALGLSFGCGGGDGDGGETVSVEISAATGGEVELSGGSLSIPAGALAADTTITATSASPSGLPDAATLKGLAFDFGPDGLEFLTPVTLALPVSGTPGDGQEVVISWLDESTDTWEDVTTTATGGMATAEITHFTTFIVRFRDGGAVDCTFSACGGDLVATWGIDGLCAVTDNSPFQEVCPNATIDITIDGSGSVMFNQDLTFAVDIDLTGSAQVNFPAECLTGKTDCNLNPKEGWTCTGTVSTSCDCAIPLGDMVMESGTYVVEGNTFTTTNTGEQPGTPNDFCVDGDTLKVRSAEGFIYTATRQ